MCRLKMRACPPELIVVTMDAEVGGVFCNGSVFLMSQL